MTGTIFDDVSGVQYSTTTLDKSNRTVSELFDDVASAINGHKTKNDTLLTQLTSLEDEVKSAFDALDVATSGDLTAVQDKITALKLLLEDPENTEAISVLEALDAIADKVNESAFTIEEHTATLIKFDAALPMGIGAGGTTDTELQNSSDPDGYLASGLLFDMKVSATDAGNGIVFRGGNFYDTRYVTPKLMIGPEYTIAYKKRVPITPISLSLTKTDGTTTTTVGS